MNPFEFVLGIILITTIGAILKARFGHHRRDRNRDSDEPREDAETLRLKEEVRALKDRIHVLERIAVDKENTLSREIDNLRDR